MLESVRNNKGAQQALGLIFGIVFGIFLQKAGVTRYEVIIGQLLLVDFTVLKVMMSAVVVGTLGVHLMHDRGMVNLHVREGSFGATVVGGLIFGAGFALLGYCPGTVAGAVGQGSMDALVGGVTGLMFGSWLFAVLYPRLLPLLSRGQFAHTTLEEAFHLGTWPTVMLVVILIVLTLLGLEWLGY
ncbi:MAG: YeeE/YedE family protein [Dehalococcoidia bacterium]|nr:YeeE/YedE family protein [Dehalococcoidia bacterium]